MGIGMGLAIAGIAMGIGIGLAIVGVGIGLAISSGEVSAIGLVLPSGRIRRWPMMSLLASWMPLRAARLAVVVP
jgi:hypothetical protein